MCVKQSMSKRCRRNNSKPWDWLEDVVHHENGDWHGKLRWDLKEAKEFLSKMTSGLSLFEDEKGYYSIHGELICTAD